MILDPYLNRNCITPFDGTRLLQETYDLVGAQILDPANPRRVWELQAFYAPIEGRALGGVRAKLTDQKDFVSFINQRDLEVLLGIGEPGSFCYWARQNYRDPNDPEWFGFAMDDDDADDDLQAREMLLRGQTDTGILMHGELHRRLHIDESYDVTELSILLWDTDPDTGMTPDPRLETIERRWRRVERVRQQWNYIR